MFGEFKARGPGGRNPMVSRGLRMAQASQGATQISAQSAPISYANMHVRPNFAPPSAQRPKAQIHPQGDYYGM